MWYGNEFGIQQQNDDSNTVVKVGQKNSWKERVGNGFQIKGL